MSTGCCCELFSGSFFFVGPNGRVRSGLVYDHTRRRGPLIDWGSLIWGRGQCRRLGFMVWLAIRKRLATCHRLFAAGYVGSQDCVLRGGIDETEDHLWFGCPYVIHVVDIMLCWATVGHREATLDYWLD